MSLAREEPGASRAGLRYFLRAAGFPAPMITTLAQSLLLALLPASPGAADAIAWEPKPEAAR